MSITNYITVDYKMFGILRKIMGGSARHPSMLCYWNHGTQTNECELRTLESEKSNFEKLQTGKEPKDCGGIKEEPRWPMLKNIENGFLVEVMDELHTFLGMTNAVQEKSVSMMTKAQKTQNYVDFIQPCGIGQAPYFAGTYSES